MLQTFAGLWPSLSLKRTLAHAPRLPDPLCFQVAALLAKHNSTLVLQQLPHSLHSNVEAEWGALRQGLPSPTGLSTQAINNEEAWQRLFLWMRTYWIIPPVVQWAAPRAMLVALPPALYPTLSDALWALLNPHGFFSAVYVYAHQPPPAWRRTPTQFLLLPPDGAYVAAMRARHVRLLRALDTGQYCAWALQFKAPGLVTSCTVTDAGQEIGADVAAVDFVLAKTPAAAAAVRARYAVHPLRLWVTRDRLPASMWTAPDAPLPWSRTSPHEHPRNGHESVAVHTDRSRGAPVAVAVVACDAPEGLLRRLVERVVALTPAFPLRLIGSNGPGTETAALAKAYNVTARTLEPGVVDAGLFRELSRAVVVTHDCAGVWDSLTLWAWAAGSRVVPLRGSRVAHALSVGDCEARDLPAKIRQAAAGPALSGAAAWPRPHSWLGDLRSTFLSEKVDRELLQICRVMLRGLD